MDRESSFLGCGWSFPVDFSGVPVMVDMAVDEEDIKQSLYILLSTNPGERVMHPNFGCGLQNVVFETLDANTVTLIENRIETAVLFYEHRIKLDEILFDTTAIYDGILRITLIYTVCSTNHRSNIVYPFYLNEGTDISFE